MGMDQTESETSEKGSQKGPFKVLSNLIVRRSMLHNDVKNINNCKIGLNATLPWILKCSNQVC